MSTKSKTLEKFVENYISLNQKDMTASAKSRDNFLDQFKKKIREDNNGPKLYGQEPIVHFGSRFDGCQYGDIDEMDLLIVIDSNTGRFSSSGDKIGDGLGVASPNHKYDSRFMKDDNSGVSGNKLLYWVKGIAADIIEKGYKASVTPTKDGQAIRVEVASLNLSFDLVPAGIFEHANGRGTFYNISDGTNGDGWILTNPKADKARVQDLNKEYDRFCDVIRVVKFIRDHYGIKIISHSVKCAVADYAEGTGLSFTWQNNFWEDLIGSLEHLESSLRSKHIPNILDSYISGKKDNVIADLENHIACADKCKRALDNLKSVDFYDSSSAYASLVSALSSGKIAIKESNKSQTLSELLKSTEDSFATLLARD